MRKKIWYKNVMGKRRLFWCFCGEIVLWNEVIYLFIKDGDIVELGVLEFIFELSNFIFEIMEDFFIVVF